MKASCLKIYINKNGACMAEITVREALQLAMKEEMQRDERVFILGEEVAEYQGAYRACYWSGFWRAQAES